MRGGSEITLRLIAKRPHLGFQLVLGQDAVGCQTHGGQCVGPLWQLLQSIWVGKSLLKHKQEEVGREGRETHDGGLSLVLVPFFNAPASEPQLGHSLLHRLPFVGEWRTWQRRLSETTFCDDVKSYVFLCV